jgi:hypothetical protein
MVPPGLVLRHDLEVCTSAVEPVVVQEDNFMAWRHGADDLAVQVAEAVLHVRLPVSDRVPLAAVALSAVAPPELGKQGEVLVIDEGELTLG